MASTYINSPNGSGTDPQIATFSMWFKVTKPEATEAYLFSGGDGSVNNSWLRFQGSTGQLYFRNRTSNINDCIIQTNAQYRDVNGWYHVVLKLNSTLSTAADRATMYVNGEEITSFSSSIDMTQNNLFHMFGSTTTHIGKRVNDGSSGALGGFLASHVHFCDGYAYDATAFGQYDANGVWTIKTSPSVTYGTRGFFILKDGNSVTDQSGNGNNFTVAGGTLTNTEDNPSNVFATLNSLYNVTTFNGNLSNGNLTAASSNVSKGNILSTLGASQGKWYWEVKCDSGGQNGIGISNDELSLNAWSPSSGNYVIWNGENGSIYRPSGQTASGVTFTTSDIIGVAWNADDAEVTFYKNGTAINSGTAYSVEGTQGTMFASLSDVNTADNPTASMNFGNGYFGTTAVSSAGTNASGIGIFEYDVPTGYTALSTKGLNL